MQLKKYDLLINSNWFYQNNLDAYNV